MIEKTKPADPDFHLYFLGDGLSNIFLRGVIIYEMAAGNRPFLGESLATISNRILSQMPILASDLNPQMSPALDAVLVQARRSRKCSTPCFSLDILDQIVYSYSKEVRNYITALWLYHCLNLDKDYAISQNWP